MITEDHIKLGRAMMEVLARAPRRAIEVKVSRSEHETFVHMSRAEALQLFEQAIAAVDYFLPMYSLFDSIHDEARRSWWFRLFHWKRFDASGQLRRFRQSFDHYCGVVRASSQETLLVEDKLVAAAEGWIE